LWHRAVARVVVVLVAPAFARRFELAIARGPDLVLASRQLVGRGDEADRAVQPVVVVVLDEASDEFGAS
jgi:hypothetical protein